MSVALPFDAPEIDDPDDEEDDDFEDEDDESDEPDDEEEEEGAWQVGRQPARARDLGRPPSPSA